MNNGDDSRSWSGARDRCVALGGYLAFPTSSSEYDAINQYRLNTDGVGGDGHDTWGGIYQSDGVWYNVLGNRQHYFRWDNNEPSGGEYCVQFRDSEDMNDEDCPRDFRFVCQRAWSCSSCPPGKFSDGTFACTSCPAGNHSADAGASTCTACAAGMFSAGGASQCSACAAGTFSAAGAGSCVSCLPGAFSPSNGSSSCSPCPLPNSSSPAGSATCLCDAGFAGDGVTTCQPCSAGSFSTAGAANCSHCPRGSWSPAGSVSVLNCSCNAGFYNDVAGNSGPVGGGACQACAAGSFKSWLGGGLCTNCSASTYASSPGATFCTTCATGTYASSPGATSCMPCPSGTVGTSLVGSTSASGCVVSCNAAPATKPVVTCLRAYACVPACIHGHNT